MSSFGERLRIEREKKGFNQKEFAEAIGVTPTRLNYWEKDKREPDFPNIRKMIDILGCDADYLIGTKQSSNNADMPTLIAEKYGKLDDKYKKLVENQILQLLEIQEKGKQ